MPLNGERSKLRKLSASDLSKIFQGTSSTWWRARLSRLRSDGVLTLQGKKHFGRIVDVEHWLTNESRPGSAPTATADEAQG